jgi:hypothetical protein
MNMKAVSASIFAAASLFAIAARAADSPTLSEPVKSVYNHYLKIQGELARDSLTGVEEQANAIAKEVRGDDLKRFPAVLAKQAETLAKAGVLRRCAKHSSP